MIYEKMEFLKKFFPWTKTNYKWNPLRMLRMANFSMS